MQFQQTEFQQTATYLPRVSSSTARCILDDKQVPPTQLDELVRAAESRALFWKYTTYHAPNPGNTDSDWRPSQSGRANCEVSVVSGPHTIRCSRTKNSWSFVVR